MEKEPLAVQLQGASIRALDRDPDEADMLRTAAEYVERMMDSITIRLDDIRPSFCEALIRAFEEEVRIVHESTVGNGDADDETGWRDHVAITLARLVELRESLG